MTNPALDEFIVRLVTDDGPIKAVDLSLQIATHQEDVTGNDINEAFERLVKEHRIVEVEYVLPQMSSRVKSMYFPPETQVRIKG